MTTGMEKESKESALWRKVSEQEKEKIKEQAKQIMDSFASALKPLEKEAEAEEASVEREEFAREESQEQEKAGSEFRNIIFKNAKKKDENCIIAEKGEWV